MNDNPLPSSTMRGGNVGWASVNTWLHSQILDHIGAGSS
ncbi:hypothetical protein DB30_07714 [Enhygromyxa salina]|uniref:Uncharacterized protein n=1 Tax=Enhygromyxa salina TaxID=215803 RepID=A0A0C1ZMP5_9BACT|nr:hypothetical protein DB30_07714 [Enhygromyxa salina]